MPANSEPAREHPAAHGGKRPPLYFRGRAHMKDSGLRFDKLSKADWADVFCDLYRQVNGECSTPEEMLRDAERRIELLKAQGLR